MSSEWKEYSIQDLIDKGLITLHKDGNHGSNYPRVSEFCDQGVPFLTAKSIKNNQLDIRGAPRLKPERVKEFKIGFVKGGDVLLSHNATVGRVAVVPPYSGDLLIGTSLTCYRLDKSRILPEYLAAYMNGRQFQHQLSAGMSQTTRNQVPITAQRRLKIVIPPLEYQKKISLIVGGINRKIEVNMNINSKSKIMTGLLFRSWFVNYDPVLAKRLVIEKGLDSAYVNRSAMAVLTGVCSPNDYIEKIEEMDEILSDKISMMSREKLSELDRIASLFPSSFEECELGTIPSGWGTEKISSIAEFKNGCAVKSGEMLEEESSDTIRVFKMGNICKGGGFNSDGTKSYLPLKSLEKYKNYLLKKGDVLMCMTDMKNNVALLGHTAYMDVNDQYIQNQRVGLLRVKDQRLSAEFIYFLTNEKSFLLDLRRRANSGVQVNLSTSGIKSTQFVLPPQELVEEFTRLATNVLETSSVRSKESKAWSNLKDTLLPRILEREIDLSDIRLEALEVDCI